MNKQTIGFIAAVLFLGATTVSVHAQVGNDGSELALNEKRLMKELTDTNIPEFVAHVEKQCGAKLKVEVDWNSFKGDETGLRAFNLDALEKVSSALDQICSDALGKEGVSKKLNAYQIRNVKPDQKKVAFESGILSMDAGFGAEWGAGAIDGTAIKELLEGKL